MHRLLCRPVSKHAHHQEKLSQPKRLVQTYRSTSLRETVFEPPQRGILNYGPGRYAKARSMAGRRAELIGGFLATVDGDWGRCASAEADEESKEIGLAQAMRRLSNGYDGVEVGSSYSRSGRSQGLDSSIGASVSTWRATI
jgi:hypothetical protein